MDDQKPEVPQAAGVLLDVADPAVVAKLEASFEQMLAQAKTEQERQFIYLTKELAPAVHRAMARMDALGIGFQQAIELVASCFAAASMQAVGAGADPDNNRRLVTFMRLRGGQPGPDDGLAIAGTMFMQAFGPMMAKQIAHTLDRKTGPLIHLGEKLQ